MCRRASGSQPASGFSRLLKQQQQQQQQVSHAVLVLLLVAWLLHLHCNMLCLAKMHALEKGGRAA
jgi:hypothetical protein